MGERQRTTAWPSRLSSAPTSEPKLRPPFWRLTVQEMVKETVREGFWILLSHVSVGVKKLPPNGFRRVTWNQRVTTKNSLLDWTFWFSLLQLLSNKHGKETSFIAGRISVRRGHLGGTGAVYLLHGEWEQRCNHVAASPNNGATWGLALPGGWRAEWPESGVQVFTYHTDTSSGVTTPPPHCYWKG